MPLRDIERVLPEVVRKDYRDDPEHQGRRQQERTLKPGCESEVAWSRHQILCLLILFRTNEFRAPCNGFVRNTTAESGNCGVRNVRIWCRIYCRHRPTAIGAFVVKGISRHPIAGNPAPRIWEAEGGMINSIGLQNIGVEAFIKEKAPAVGPNPDSLFRKRLWLCSRRLCGSRSAPG